MADAGFPSPTGAGPPEPVGGGSRIQVLGVNQLQTSIDSLTSAVSNLSAKLSSGGMSAPSLNATAAGGNGATGFSNPGFPSPSGNFNSPSGSVPPPTLNAMSSGGNGGWGGALAGAGAAAASSNLGGAMSSLGSYGSGQMSNMAAISAYLQQGSVFGGGRSGMMNAAGFGGTLNDIANSANDAAQGQALINYASGAYGTQNALSRGITGATRMAGFLNPTLGYTGSAALGQQIYSQGMSMNMLAFGYGLTPRTMSGGTNSIAAVNQAIMQRTFGGSKVNQKSFNASAAIGGRLNYNLQGLGLSGTDLTGMESMLSAQNKLANAGYSNSQIQGIFSGAASGNQGSLNALTHVGINASSVLQTLKNKTAIQTQRSGDTEQGFEAGLRQSVGLLNNFNKALNGILSGPLGRVIGYGSGLGGSGILGAAKDFMSGNIMGGVKSILGGGAAAPSATGMSTQKRPSAKPGAVSGAANAAIGWAKQELGVPYLWGGEQPGVGFDCSGLTQWAYSQAGVKIPRTSQQQWASLSKGHSVGLNQVQSGDLVFTAGSDGTYSAPGHVAMMVSPNMLIQAEQTGTNIMLTPFDPRQWDHAARPTGPGTAGTGPSGSGTASGGSGLGMASGFGGYSEGGSMGSTAEADAINGSMGGGGFMSGFTGQTGTTGSRGPGGRNAPGAPANVSKNAALAKKMAAKRGWSGVQWNDLYALWTRESGFNQNAVNSSSGAWGIPQALPGNKMASAGADWRTNPATQIAWGLSYIGGRYKNPAGAWAHEQSNNWYARGTNNANPGVAILGEEGPEAVRLPGGAQVMTAGQTAGYLAQIQSGQGRPLRGGGMTINVNVSPGAISISATGTGSDVSSSAREIASQLGSYLEQEAIIQKLAAGVSN